jgi:N-hydroxyarylamine O-acetyltransferase
VDVSRYLGRIAYDGPFAPTAETLRSLHVAHLRTVPFENLSILAGEPILLDLASLFDKIVLRKRGGFCYELNGLFAALLRELGFDVTLLSARVASANGDFSPEFDHLALTVEAGGRRLVDVGFGDLFLEPVRMDVAGEQVQGERAYRIEPLEERLLLRQRDQAGEWTRQYSISLTPRSMSEFEERCRFHQTSPESHFTQNRICSLATPDGRITLSNMRLITTQNGGRQERTLVDEQECAAILRDHFGVL